MGRILRRIKDEKGQSLVEFTLVLIILLLLFFGIVEFGRAWYRADRLKNAANIAARTYAAHPTDWNRAKFAAYSAMGTTRVDVTPYPAVDVSPFPNATSIKVTVRGSFRSVLASGTSPSPPLFSAFIGFGNNTSIRRDATYRIER